jgi:hypothetical protein
MGVPQPAAAGIAANVLVPQLRRFDFLLVEVQGDWRVIHGNPGAAGFPIYLTAEF